METHVSEEEPELGHSTERTFQQREERTPGLGVGLRAPRGQRGGQPVQLWESLPNLPLQWPRTALSLSSFTEQAAVTQWPSVL